MHGSQYVKMLGVEGDDGGSLKAFEYYGLLYIMDYFTKCVQKKMFGIFYLLIPHITRGILLCGESTRILKIQCIKAEICAT